MIIHQLWRLLFPGFNNEVTYWHDWLLNQFLDQIRVVFLWRTMVRTNSAPGILSANTFYKDMSNLTKLFQGSYRQVWVKFKDFKRTSQDYPTLFKDSKFMKIPDLGDNCIQNFDLGRYIVGYTVGNLVLRRRLSGAVKHDFRTYIWQYTSPNQNFEYGYPHSNALLTFSLKKTQ